MRMRTFFRRAACCRRASSTAIGQWGVRRGRLLVMDVLLTVYLYYVGLRGKAEG